MIIVLIILSVGLLGVIIYLTFSPKSSRLLKRSGIGALAAIFVAVGICVVLIIRGPQEDTSGIPMLFLLDAPVQPASRVNVVDIIILVVLMGAISLVILKALRDEKNARFQVKKTKSSPVLTDDDDIDFGESRKKRKEEDNFDEGLEL